MENKALVIIPYFGKLPSWFQLFLDSCNDTKLLDFLLITDDRTEFDFPDNFIIKYKTFEEEKKLYQLKLGDVYLGHPYKLCDYKPAFGYVYELDKTQYTYWGYCDVDIIFGDIDFFLSEHFKKGFDKLFTYGHLAFYRNSLEINSIFKANILKGVSNFNYVSHTTYPNNFDEIGIRNILLFYGFKVVENQYFENVNVNFRNFAIGNGQPLVPQLILKTRNDLQVLEQNYSRKILYIHFMWRKDLKVECDRLSDYIICVDGFLPFDSQKKESLFIKYGKNEDCYEQNIYKKWLKNYISKNKRERFNRELRTFHFKGIMNIVVRYLSIKNILK